MIIRLFGSFFSLAPLLPVAIVYSLGGFAIADLSLIAAFLLGICVLAFQSPEIDAGQIIRVFSGRARFLLDRNYFLQVNDPLLI